MLADKTLLSVTLAATFASGAVAGYAAKAPATGAGAPMRTISAIYAPQLEALAGQGYDESELAEARQAYAECLKSYDVWWNAFLDNEKLRANTDKADEKLETRLAELAAQHTKRTGAK